ncbi:hypothetical protein [Moorena sp. SIO4G3]|uniref:hypothetical protein n=1 Tax=Moorena sp. SIO4G3 TaxID=2607821 RepID=UPI0025EC47F0|nr:hypothetical protein [Moorena sp. SIO4G3]
MDEQRLQEYLNLIDQLLTCSSGELVQILESNRELVDGVLLLVMELKAEELAADGNQNSANFLRSLGSQLLAVISETPTSANSSSEDYLEFLMEVLPATAESNGDPTVVYPLLQANLDKLDDNFIDILEEWANAKLSELEPELAEPIAEFIGKLSNLIINFPLGNQANNIEIAIAGYETMLTVFTRESNPKSWALKSSFYCCR